MSDKKEKFYLGNQNLPSPDSEFAWTPEMLKELKKCKKNILHFAETYFYIINLDEGRQKIKLHKYQKRLLKALQANRFNIVLASRQCGKTTITTIFALWLANFFEDQNILLVANKEATAIGIFKRIRLAYEMLPNHLKSGTVEWGKTSLMLANGSSIGVSTTSSDAGRGSSCNCLILDEFGFIPNELSEPFWSSVYPVISQSKKSKIIILSTPNGTDNLFYELYNKAEKGENGWHNERIDWWEVPGRDEKWKEETMKSMNSLDAFLQEYENVFHRSGESAAADDVIKKMTQNCKDPEYIFDNGAYRVWEEPNKDAIYVAGIDISEGVNEAASVIHIFDYTDLTNIRQVATYHSRKIVPYLFTQKCLEILRQWGCPPVAIERNNCGAQVIDSLRNTHGYEQLINFSPKENDQRLGCIAHTNTKQLGVTNMRYWVNQLNVVTLRDINTVNELKDFIRYPNGTWAAKPGADSWDDRIMAMIWALIVLNGVITEKYFEIIKYDDYRKPLIIRPWDYEQKKEMINPAYIYENEKQISDEERGRFTLPTVFQNVKFGDENIDPSLEELVEQGWERLQ